MKNLKNGYYKEPHTTNVIAIIDNVGYCVSSIGKITNERIPFNFFIVEKWDYRPFENKKNQLNKVKISSEKELVDFIIKHDYYSNFYTMNGDIEILTLKALLRLRKNASIENIQVKFTPILLHELRWDNWNDIPSILNKKSSENLFFIENYNGRATKDLYCLKYGDHNISGHIVTEWLCPDKNFYTDNTKLVYKNNRATIEADLISA